jgi:hypothetical protein
MIWFTRKFKNLVFPEFNHTHTRSVVDLDPGDLKLTDLLHPDCNYVITDSDPNYIYHVSF